MIIVPTYFFACTFLCALPKWQSTISVVYKKNKNSLGIGCIFVVQINQQAIQQFFLNTNFNAHCRLARKTHVKNGMFFTLNKFTPIVNVVNNKYAYACFIRSMLLALFVHFTHLSKNV